MTTRKKPAKPKKKKKPQGRGVRAGRRQASEFTAIDGCLNQDDAMSLVFSCAGGPVNVRTQLGTLRPGDIQRRQFCGCVFRKAKDAGCTIEASDIPCGKTKTVGDVIDAISC